MGARLLYERAGTDIGGTDGRSVDEGLADTAKEVCSVATEGGRRGRVEREGFSQAAQRALGQEVLKLWNETTEEDE